MKRMTLIALIFALSGTAQASYFNDKVYPSTGNAQSDEIDSLLSQPTHDVSDAAREFFEKANAYEKNFLLTQNIQDLRNAAFLYFQSAQMGELDAIKRIAKLRQDVQFKVVELSLQANYEAMLEAKLAAGRNGQAVASLSKLKQVLESPNRQEAMKEIRIVMHSFARGYANEAELLKQFSLAAEGWNSKKLLTALSAFSKSDDPRMKSVALSVGAVLARRVGQHKEETLLLEEAISARMLALAKEKRDAFVRLSNEMAGLEQGQPQ